MFEVDVKKVMEWKGTKWNGIQDGNSPGFSLGYKDLV